MWCNRAARIQWELIGRQPHADGNECYLHSFPGRPPCKRPACGIVPRTWPRPQCRDSEHLQTCAASQGLRHLVNARTSPRSSWLKSRMPDYLWTAVGNSLHKSSFIKKEGFRSSQRQTRQDLVSFRARLQFARLRRTAAFLSIPQCLVRLTLVTHLGHTWQQISRMFPHSGYVPTSERARPAEEPKEAWVCR